MPYLLADNDIVRELLGNTEIICERLIGIITKSKIITLPQRIEFCASITNECDTFFFREGYIILR
jgi:hypothetical protein